MSKSKVATCNHCGAEVDRPFSCNYCNRGHCTEHRLPENHECLMINVPKKKDEDDTRSGPEPLDLSDRPHINRSSSSERNSADQSETQPKPDPDPPSETSPDVALDGSIDKSTADTSSPTGSSSRSTTTGSAARTAGVKTKAWVKAPFHLFRHYLAAILAFLLVFGGFFLLLGMVLL